MFTFEPVSASCEPAWAPKHERDQQLRRRQRQPVRRHDDDHRQQRRDGRVDGDERGQGRDDQHHQEHEPPPARPGPVDELLAGPRRDAGRVERLADHEQRRDEDHDRVAEPGEGLLEGQDARSPTGPARRRSRRPRPGTGPRRTATTSATMIAKVIAMSLIGGRLAAVRAGPGIPARAACRAGTRATKSDDPDGRHDHDVREHQRDDRADPGVLLVALGDRDHERQVDHQRRDDVHRRVADPVGRQAGLRRDAELDEERDRRSARRSPTSG